MNQSNGDIIGTSFESMLEEKQDFELEEPACDTVSGQRVTEARVVQVEDLGLLFAFIEESQDHLETIEEKILHLENTGDPETVDEIFRSMHTMKGTASFFGFETIQDLSHTLENVLDELRSGEMPLSNQHIDLLLAGTDILTGMISSIARAAAAHENSSAAGVDGDGEPIEITEPSVDRSEFDEKLRALYGAHDDTREDARESKGESSRNPGEDALAGEELITDEIREGFIAESIDLLDSTEEHILSLETDPANIEVLDGAFRCIHTLKGNAGFLGYGDLEKVCMELETLFDALRSRKRRADQRTTGIILSTIDALRSSIAESGTDDDEAVPADGACSGEPASQDQNPAYDVAGNDSAQDPYRPLGEILVEMGALEEADLDKALDLQDRKLGEILVAEGKVDEETIEKALSSQPNKPEESGRGESGGITRKDIRVDMSKLDTLFDLMGELITAEAMVIHNPDLEGMELDRFDKATTYLSKITREMQEITMSVRMIPLEGLFNKMRRLVRDLSKRFGREIRLEISGQETEMDRNVIEEIADPLMHIIRNAIDHGIETKEARRSAGKEPKGLLSLGARYEGNEIWIRVADDGKGLDREKILILAAERGLLNGDSESMKDQEVYHLIFEPGFSTAEKVSEISGRGVGMDVVKRNVEKLRGKIDIDTTPGEGTAITLKIPLTVAIVDGITAKVGNVKYALPMGDILEFHKAREEQITRADQNREVLKLRESVIPVIKLYDFFNTSPDKPGIADGILIITQRNGRKVAMLVDEIIGYQQIVVKALPAYMGAMRAISGCSILGNGEVVLIIDVGSLLSEELA